MTTSLSMTMSISIAILTWIRFGINNY